jgi:hypothetical protein
LSTGSEDQGDLARSCQARAEFDRLRSVSCHAHDRDAGDLALGVEAKQKAGRIAAREYQLHLVECLVVYRALLHDFGADRRRSVLVELVQHRLRRAHRPIPLVRVVLGIDPGIVGGKILHLVEAMLGRNLLKVLHGEFRYCLPVAGEDSL